MSNKKGLGLVGIIIIIIVGLILLAFITTTVIPAVKSVPAVAEKQLIKVGILPEQYYVINFVDWSRGRLDFQVTEPAPLNNYVTDFNPITGYKISEDGIPTIVSSVHSYPSINVAIVADDAAACQTTLSEIKTIRLNNTFVGAFPTTADPAFVKTSDLTCIGANGDYWGAIKNATYALPGGDSYKVLLIVSEGACTTCSNQDQTVLREATAGLMRNDINNRFIITEDGNCNKNDVLKSTNDIISTDTINNCYKTDQLPDLIKTIEDGASIIELNYKPFSTFGKHTVSVTATKRPYSGKGNVTFSYG